MRNKSIFVQLAAYRDLELQRTIDDAIQQSSGLFKIHFGVHNCFLTIDEVLGEQKLPPSARMSIYESRAPENIGVQASRQIANSFYAGEDYYLQIDSHSRFMPNWDKHLALSLDLYHLCGLEKPLITQYPAIYTYDEELKEIFTPDRNTRPDQYWPTRISFDENKNQFMDTRIPTQTAVSMEVGCGYTASISAGFIFCDGDFSKITPNPKIAFWGEETLTAARVFTHGFNPVVPFRDVIWHLYVSGQPPEKTRRRHVWVDFPDLWAQLDSQSKIEYFRIMTQREIGEYALGSERSLDEYEQFAGLDFRTGEVTQIDLRKLY